MSPGQTEGMEYEAFMLRALGRSMGRTTSRDPHATELSNLFWKEDRNHSRFVTHLKETAIRERLRKQVRRGLDKMLKWKLSETERQRLLAAHAEIDNAHTAQHFYSIVQIALDATQRFKESKVSITS